MPYDGAMTFPPGGITAALLGPLLAGDPHRPRLIWHGAGRTELSTASLANWSAKTAGLLVDELGGRPGGVVVWRVRRSWQAVPLLLGSWWAGMVVTDLYDEAAESRAVAAFIDDDDDSGADEVIVASSHPFGLATGEISEYAQRCPSCGAYVSDAEATRTNFPWWVILTAGVLVAAMLLGWFGGVF